MPRSRLNMPKSLERGRNNQVLLYAQEAHVGLSVLAACMASSRPAPESTSRLTFAAGDGRSIARGCAKYIRDQPTPVSNAREGDAASQVRAVWIETCCYPELVQLPLE